MKISITTNEILIPKKIFSSKVDKELEFDSSLPEFCPDIARIIKIDCTPFSERCEIADGKATVKGKAVYDVLYETDYKNRLRCCNFTQEFSQSIPLPRSNATDVSAFCKVICERISCKLISPRRLAVKATLGAQFDLEGETASKAVAVNEDEETFFRKKTIGFDGRTKQYEGVYKFGDRLALAQSEKPIGEIVCANITIQSPQVSLSPGRAEIKAVAAVHVLCEEENNEGKYYMSSKTLPVNIEFSNDAIDTYKHISVALEPYDTEVSPELDQYGESRVIKTAFSVKAKLNINEPKAYTVADDLFEKNYDSTPVKTTAVLPHLSYESESGFSAETKISEITPKPEVILDSSARDYGSIIEKSEGGITVNGAFIVTMLTDTQDGIQSFDQSIPYSQFIPLDTADEPSQIVADVVPLEVIPTLHSDGSITLRVIANAKIYIYHESEESFISDVTKRTPRQNADSGTVLIYRYPEKNDELWSVAKNYRIDPESISASNPSSFDESGKATECGKPILIKA